MAASGPAPEGPEAPKPVVPRAATAAEDHRGRWGPNDALLPPGSPVVPPAEVQPVKEYPDDIHPRRLIKEEDHSGLLRDAPPQEQHGGTLVCLALAVALVAVGVVLLFFGAKAIMEKPKTEPSTPEKASSTSQIVPGPRGGKYDRVTSEANASSVSEQETTENSITATDESTVVGEMT